MWKYYRDCTTVKMLAAAGKRILFEYKRRQRLLDTEDLVEGHRENSIRMCEQDTDSTILKVSAKAGERTLFENRERH